jgi:HSP20 family molecular chaperone IbpA
MVSLKFLFRMISTPLAWNLPLDRLIKLSFCRLLRQPTALHIWYQVVANKHTEEKAADDAARAKEAEEQAALPYKWTQTIGDLDITTEIPGNLKAKDLIVDIKKTKLVVGIKGQEPILSVRTSYYYLFCAVTG